MFLFIVALDLEDLQRRLTYKDVSVCKGNRLPGLYLCRKICFSSVNSGCSIIVFLRNISVPKGLVHIIPIVYIHISCVCPKEPMWMFYYTYLKSFRFLRARVVCAEQSVNPFGVLVSFGPVSQPFRVKGSVNTVFLHDINCLLRPLSVI